ncbi:aconitase X [Synechococcus sp. RSCCF101]|uniref:aconitase X n=1 Tax=Synechococcus sp. RSCCF101 TaxID=2511069 RepID=UPI0017844F5E|nr:aconitase X [Synechococcus sp. RSCCF101]
MERRALIKSLAAAAAVTAAAVKGGQSKAAKTAADVASPAAPEAASGSAIAAAPTGRRRSPSRGGASDAPAWAPDFKTTDMLGTGPDGAPNGQRATFTGSSMAGATAATAGSKMTLTPQEQAILDGKEGPEKAKLMTILVRFGETFGATKMVDLGGAPHSNLYIGAPYLESLIVMLEECAAAGLKSYAPYTVNPRPYDVYNVQNNPTEMQLIAEGYPLQMRLDAVHSALGAPDLNYRSCACYTKDVGNAPAPGTSVAWCESSAVNYGNSVLGIRTNRYGAGMEMLCAMLGKAPYFGLMTDEGRQAKWLIDVKTTSEPDWGVLGTAIGRKCVEDIPYIAGVAKYFPGGKVTDDNWYKLKYMGSATAAAGAVGCYHVEGVTPEPKEKGRDMLAQGYKTYVFDDKEQQAILDTFENLWDDPNGDPTAVFIGCPHCNYEETVRWARMLLKGMDQAGRQKLALPVYIFAPTVTRTRILLEEPQLASRGLAAGIHVTNMCGVSYSGMKGFSERVRAVTNSAKNRNYSPVRYFPDQKLVSIAVTGKV